MPQENISPEQCQQISHANIVDEQPHFVIIDKPEQLNFHDETHIGSGLFSQVKSLLNTDELYPVHRLDKMTSGLVIFAKSLSAAQTFQQLFEQHQVDKYYLAISDKKPNKKQGLIKGDMAKSRRGSWKLLRTMVNPAITQFFSYPLKPGFRLFLLKPHSGKTHQIRVALSSIGAPIVGDAIYHKQSKQDRGYLHAFSLTFTLFGTDYHYQAIPKTGEHFIDDLCKQQLLTLAEPAKLNWPKIK